MERNANFILVGVFAIISIVSLAGFAFWMGKYGVDEDRFESYKTYIYESVGGLKASSPVKLKGIEVGFVEELRIDPDNPERVEINFKVEKEIPVKTDSIIVLNSQGIAGISFLEIKGGSKGAQPLHSAKRGERLEIGSEPSVVVKLTDQAQSILTQLTQTLQRAQRLTSDKNIDNVATTLENVAQISTGLKANQHELSGVITGAKEVEEHAGDTLKEVAKVTRKTDLVLDETRNLAIESSALIREIQKADTVNRVSSTLDVSNEAIEEMKSLLVEGKSLVREFKESPRDLLFKDKRGNPGPGE
ncbi:MAG: MlaD family protein [Sulfuricurvum sp.]|jgi:phospholipid/cholesterol/gamma-HCH transport system substrate-binding protein|uniref:MlaD family protein n=1 Tax=Sulfuricurvum sp. TaxID=2025608 RepID=UPI0025D2FDCB|nr:MlaD family protein [Sulfuricurvum sp.]MCK9373716.1 MlaD family protein [Sulfuricurvum sp.]